MSKARNIAALSTVEVGATADQTKADLNAIGVSGGRKNLIINGGFDVWQRGTNITTGVGYSYGPDRLSDYWGATYLKQTATINSETVNTCKITAQSSYLYIYNKVEDNLTNNVVANAWYVGKTISFWYRSNLATAMGGYSGLNAIGDGVWRYHSHTITSAADNLFQAGGVTSGSSYIEIANLQLELGSVATDFEHRSYGEELALCQRYYEEIKIANDRVIGCGGVVGGSYFVTYITALAKRGAATYSYTGTLNAVNSSGGVVQTGPSFSPSSEIGSSHFPVTAYHASGLTGTVLLKTSSAFILKINAEL